MQHNSKNITNLINKSLKTILNDSLIISSPNYCNIPIAKAPTNRLVMSETKRQKNKVIGFK